MPRGLIMVNTKQSFDLVYWKFQKLTNMIKFMTPKISYSIIELYIFYIINHTYVYYYIRIIIYHKNSRNRL